MKQKIKSIAIGSFDGIHIAHQKLIEHSDALVIIERNYGSLSAGYRRSLYTSKICIFYHFDTIKLLSPLEFVVKLNSDFPYLEKIVVGYDFYFGKGKEGDAQILEALCEKEVIIIDQICLDNIPVHSRTIKEYIRGGNIEMANRFLGRRYSIVGDIISGQGLGKKELFATINLSVEDFEIPKDGVYASFTNINDISYPSVSFLGHRVTTDGSYAIETHILDKDIEVVEGKIEVEFVDFIRDNQKFDNLIELKKQIERDINLAKKVLL
ncbi:MAG: bifunctional riboflavin kinase/FAD synthetase [Sulfurovum sp.]